MDIGTQPNPQTPVGREPSRLSRAAPQAGYAALLPPYGLLYAASDDGRRAPVFCKPEYVTNNLRIERVFTYMPVFACAIVHT